MVQLQDEDPFEENEFIVIPEEVGEFKDQIYKELEENKNLYHPKDIETIKNNYEVCRRYVRHKKKDIEAAVELAKKSLRWRNEFGVNDLHEGNIYKLYMNVGCFIPFKKDKLGSQVIIFRSKLHRKHDEKAADMRRYLVFWVEKFLYEHNVPRMTFVFDCTDANYANMDMDQIYFIIELFNGLYPWALGHVVIYNMPWILKAVWNAIKAMVPADGIDRFKFCSREDIFQLIDRENLPDFMGGTNSIPFRDLSAAEIDEITTNPNIENKICTTPAITKFYRDNFGLFKESSAQNPINGSGRRMNIFKSNPQGQLVFDILDDLQTSSFELTNTNPDGRPIAYKVKVNCLQGYNVKPFYGCLTFGATVMVNVTKDIDYAVLNSDKLLIQAVPLDVPLSPAQLNEFWKTIDRSQVFEQKLRCTADGLSIMGDDDGNMVPSNAPLVGIGFDGDSAASSKEGSTNDAVDRLERRVSVLIDKYNTQRTLNMIVFFVLFVNIAIVLQLKVCTSDPRQWFC